MKKALSYIIVVFLITSCKHDGKKDNRAIFLHYDLYNSDGSINRDALEIEYKGALNDTLRMVDIKADTLKISFSEKINRQGIYRSFDSSGFHLTHSFTIGQRIESNLGREYPLFVNNWVTAIKKKGFLSGKDSLNVIWFDEMIPAYSGTSAYYVKELGIFIIYYNFIKNKYYKLSRAEGISNPKEIVEIANEISKDTLFFSKYDNKPPRREAPPLLVRHAWR